jgi:hypothetical protein
MVERDDLPVVHTTTPMRYDHSQPPNIRDVLLQEVAKGKQAITAFTLQHFSVEPTH